MRKQIREINFPKTFIVKNYINLKINIERIIKIICTQIFNYTNNTIIVTLNPKLLDNVSTKDYNIDALLYKSNLPNTYNLILRSTENIINIICHEMIHFNQYETGKLIVEKDKFIWLDKEYKSDLEYMKRPWEIEAFSNQYKIYKKMKKIYYL